MGWNDITLNAETIDALRIDRQQPVDHILTKDQKPICRFIPVVTGEVVDKLLGSEKLFLE
ncbi:hypothetical protein ACVME8_000141 [Bradyrhizobium diazoefficiens]